MVNIICYLLLLLLLLLLTTISIHIMWNKHRYKENEIKTNRQNESARRASIVRLSHAVNGDAHTAVAIAQQPSP